MQDFPSIIKGAHFHLVGVKGTGMAALAELLAGAGAVITGSDVADVFYTDEIIKRLGIKALPFSEGNITSETQCVIHSSAYSAKTNSDLKAAEEKGLPIFLYTEALGEISRRAFSAGICGVHGKTSTTGLAGTILSRLPLCSQVLAGSVITSFGAPPVHSCVMSANQSASAGKKYFAAETCEYQRHFMSFHPQKIVLTSVESDHQDCFPAYADILAAFVDYICLLPKGGEVIYCADDKGACEAVETATHKRPDLTATAYGLKAKGDYRITLGSIADGVRRFEVDCMKGKPFSLHVPGIHEVLDAAGAIALSRSLLKADGKNPDDYSKSIQEGVSLFTGGKRRSEVVGRGLIGTNDTIFIDDYGHHPTAIRTTLAGYREFYGGRRMVVDFMSHTHTRTAALLDEFALAFDSADDVIINKIYGSAREGGADEMIINGKAISGKVMAEMAKKHHRHAVYAGEFSEAAEAARGILAEPLPPQYPNGCLFVTMGAGDNWKVGEMVMKEAKH